MERKKKRKEAREERLGGEAEELSAKRRNSANFLPFRIRYAHRQHTVIVYFVLALRSAFRNELSYGAKTPIDTVCITAVCNDRRLRVCAMRSLSLSLPPFLLLSAVFYEETRVSIVPMDTPVWPVSGSSVSNSKHTAECHRPINVRRGNRDSYKRATATSRAMRFHAESERRTVDRIETNAHTFVSVGTFTKSQVRRNYGL